MSDKSQETFKIGNEYYILVPKSLGPPIEGVLTAILEKIEDDVTFHYYEFRPKVLHTFKSIHYLNTSNEISKFLYISPDEVLCTAHYILPKSAASEALYARR